MVEGKELSYWFKEFLLAEKVETKEGMSEAPDNHRNNVLTAAENSHSLILIPKT